MIDHRVMTVREPFASLLAYGLKKYETARPATGFRGLVFIHAGLGTSDRHRAIGEQHRCPLFDAGLTAASDPDWFAGLARGAIIGAALLSNCRQQFDVVADEEVTAAEEAVGLWGEAYDEKYAYRIEHAVAFKAPVLGWRGNVMLQRLDAATYGRAMDALCESTDRDQWRVLAGCDVGDRRRVLTAVEADLCVTE